MIRIKVIRDLTFQEIQIKIEIIKLKTMKHLMSQNQIEIKTTGQIVETELVTLKIDVNSKMKLISEMIMIDLDTNYTKVEK